jgi:hypothetical protein
MAFVPRIGFFGAFSIDNAGDVLVGLATRQAVRARVPGCDVVTFAPDLPAAGWRHDFSAARGVDGPIVPVPFGTPLDASGLDALVVGGGGILGLEAELRPFLLEGVAARSAWNAVGSQNTPWYLERAAPYYAAVRAACERLAYVSVRNRTSERFLRRCGYEGPLAVVPDPTMALEVSPVDEPTTDDRPVIGVSLGNAFLDPRAAGFHRELIAWLTAKRDARVVVLPFGNVYGDQALAMRVAAAIPGADVITDLAPLPLWRLIGRMRMYVCARYHAMFAALAQDVPFVVCDEYLSDAVASSKIREVVADEGLEPWYVAPLLTRSPTAKLDRAWDEACRGGPHFAHQRATMRLRLEAHYAVMLAALGITTR